MHLPLNQNDLLEAIQTLNIKCSVCNIPISCLWKIYNLHPYEEGKLSSEFPILLFKHWSSTDTHLAVTDSAM